MQDIHLGQIDFINCLPINYALKKFLAQKGSKRAPLFLRLHDFIIEESYPADLNKKLFTGELEIAPISSLEYLRHKDKYNLISNLSISATKQADSVLFFSKVPLDKIPEGKVYVTNKSATSVELLKIILAEKHKIVGLTFERTDDLTDKDNKLLIGDEALKADHKGYEVVLDLGTEWYEFSGGLPMVFGLWAYRKDFEMKSSILNLFKQLKTDGLEKYLHDVIAEASKKLSIDSYKIENYFKHLNYDFQEEHEKSLALFWSHAHPYLELTEAKKCQL